MLNSVIDRYRQMRNLRWLRDTYTGKYAFVGIGSHSVMNLYPVLQYLQVPVKYICCRSAGKLPLIGRKYPGVTATTSLESILCDDEVQGIFVSASHFLTLPHLLPGDGKREITVRGKACMSHWSNSTALSASPRDTGPGSSR